MARIHCKWPHWRYGLCCVHSWRHSGHSRCFLMQEWEPCVVIRHGMKCAVALTLLSVYLQITLVASVLGEQLTVSHHSLLIHVHSSVVWEYMFFRCSVRYQGGRESAFCTLLLCSFIGFLLFVRFAVEHPVADHSTEGPIPTSYWGTVLAALLIETHCIIPSHHGVSWWLLVSEVGRLRLVFPFNYLHTLPAKLRLEQWRSRETLLLIESELDPLWG